MINTQIISDIATQAGSAILEIYRHAADVMLANKADNSPLTRADTRSHEVIAGALLERFPGIPLVSEEDDGGDVSGEMRGEYWLIDPLDGTKEFIKRTGEFTVNIALVRDGVPVLGVVHAPVLGTTWAGDSNGARRSAQGHAEAIQVCAHAEPERLRVVASRDHAGPVVREMLGRLPGAQTLSMGSSLKFCLLAEGNADLYVRDGPTMPWDTAAAHAVLVAAGGEVFAMSGQPLRYSFPRIPNPQFVAVGDRAYPWASLLPTSHRR